MATSIVTQVVERLTAMPDNLQRRVLEYVEALDATARQRLSGAELLKLAGAIPPDDLREMAAAIEAGCERVDVNEW